ncbi:MAG: YbaK/EbsC family protein [Desulfobacterales bacterium]|nr:YbaK/EbsC family protein [Desulfobacterales bacterium]
MSKNIEDYLNEHHVHFEKIPHERTYTAQETAASAHVRGRDFAKSVIVKVDDQLVMMVLPAHYRTDLDFIRRMAGAGTAVLAGEAEFKDLFPDCEVGAMPPFGNLYNVDVWVDESLMWEESLVFNAGSHTELIKIAASDFKDLVHPKIVRFPTGL